MSTPPPIILCTTSKTGSDLPPRNFSSEFTTRSTPNFFAWRDLESDTSLTMTFLTPFGINRCKRASPIGPPPNMTTSSPFLEPEILSCVKQQPKFCQRRSFQRHVFGERYAAEMLHHNLISKSSSMSIQPIGGQLLQRFCLPELQILKDSLPWCSSSSDGLTATSSPILNR